MLPDVKSTSSLKSDIRGSTFCILDKVFSVVKRGELVGSMVVFDKSSDILSTTKSLKRKNILDGSFFYKKWCRNFYVMSKCVVQINLYNSSLPVIDLNKCEGFLWLSFLFPHFKSDSLKIIKTFTDFNQTDKNSTWLFKLVRSQGETCLFWHN